MLFSVRQKMEAFFHKRTVPSKSATLMVKSAPTEGNFENVQISDAKQWSLLLFVQPTFVVFRYLLGIPSTPLIRFNEKTQEYDCRAVTMTRKVLGALLLFLAVVHCYAYNKIDEASATHPTVRIIYSVSGIPRLGLIIVFYMAMTTRGTQICKLMNGIREVMFKLTEGGIQFPSSWKIHAFSVAFTITGTVILGMVTLISIDGHRGATVYQGFTPYAAAITNNYVKAMGIYIDININGSSINTADGVADKFMLTTAILIFVFNWWVCMLWAGAFFTTVCWALMFWILLDRFFHFVKHAPSRAIVEDIRKFSKITSLIDQYNEVFSAATFLAVIGGAMHFSVNLYQVFESTEGHLQRATIIASAIWYTIFMCVCAQVQQTAGKIVKFMETQFHQGSPELFAHVNSLEAAQGMMLVLHTIQTGGIGFTGLGFFTCSYPFFGTVLSAISTYAVIVIQFQGQ